MRKEKGKKKTEGKKEVMKRREEKKKMRGYRVGGRNE